MADGTAKKQVRRLLPCPLYDVHQLEQWLGDLARQGLVLKKNSYRRGGVTFKPTEPHDAQYRLTSGPRSIDDLEASRTPEGRALAKREDYQWYPAGKLGGYQVYRCLSDGRHDLNCDQNTLALNRDRARRRLVIDVILAALVLVAFPVALVLGRGLVLTMVSAGSWLFAGGLVLVLWLLIDSARVFCRVKEPGPVRRRRWRARSFLYHAKNTAQLAAVACLLVLIGVNWLLRWLGSGTADLSACPDPPFATLEELAGSPGGGRVREWYDLLSPQNITWNESSPGGGLYVDYHRAAADFLARRMAEEYVRRDSRQSGWQELECAPPEGVDWFAAYCTDPGFPTVVFCKGDVAVRAMFSPGASGTVDAWAAALADSIT